MPFSIRIAGNTTLPCLLAIKDKGYTIKLTYIELKEDELLTIFDAEKGECKYSANNAEELLGLISMWEVRGNNWKYDSEIEHDLYRDLIDSAIVHDLEGNIVEK